MFSFFMNNMYIYIYIIYTPIYIMIPPCSIELVHMVTWRDLDRWKIEIMLSAN